MKDTQFLAQIYGVRGSYPIAPEEGTQIGGNTPCLLVRTPEHVVIFDAGSGLIRLGKDLIPDILAHKQKTGQSFHITFVFTHTHSDHLLGFPFFAPLYMPDVTIHFFGPATLGMDFEDILHGQVVPQYFPVGMHEFRSTKYFQNISENMVLYFEPGHPGPRVGHTSHNDWQESYFKVFNMKYYFHPKDGVYVYRVEWQDKKLVFATDVEEYDGCDQRLIDFSAGADVLIHDAQYTEEEYRKFNGYGHSSYIMACQAAQKAGVEKLLLYHHDPNHSDADLKAIEKEAQRLFPNSELATELWKWAL